MVKNALQAQLLKAGLVDNKKAKKLSKQAVHEQRTGQSEEAELKAKIAQDKQEKLAKDQALDLEKKRLLQGKELKAAIIQMIHQHKIMQTDGDVSYQFIDESKIKKMYLNQQIYNALVSGSLVIAKDGESYALNLVNAPTNYETAKKYAEQPVIALFDQNKKILVQQTGANTQQKPWLSQSLFGKVTDLTQKKSIPLNQPAPVYSQTSVTESVEDRSISTTDQQLIQLWKKSSKIERQKFMNWLGEQSN